MINATIKFVEATERLNNNRWGRKGEDEEESEKADERSEGSEESQSERESLPRGRGGGKR